MSKESVAVKVLMAVFVTAVGLCAFSTWMSWLLEQIPEQEHHAETPRAVIPRTTQPTADTLGETVVDRSREVPEAAPPQIDASAKPASSQVDAEESVALSEDIQGRLEALRERESQLLARQEAMTLIHADIRDEKAAIEEIRRRVAHELSGVLRQVHGPNPVPQQPTTGLQPQPPNVLKAGQAGTDDSDMLDAAYDGTNSESAAAIVQRLADNGRIDTVVKLLSVMNERLAAKVLTAVSEPNPDMAAQLSDILQQQKLLQLAD
jgi:hypothetical protein